MGFPPGGPRRYHARILAEKPFLGQSVVLDYKAGPDGYTLLVANTGQMAIKGSLNLEQQGAEAAWQGRMHLNCRCCS